MESKEVLKAREKRSAGSGSVCTMSSNRVAQLQAGNRNVQTFRILQEQCRVVGQRRVEALMKLAEAERE